MSSKTRMLKLVKGLCWRELRSDVYEDPAVLSYRDERGRNWLHLACSVNLEKQGMSAVDSVRTVDVLLDAGLGINDPAFSEGEWKATPLWFSVAFGDNLELAKHLLKRGSDPRYCLWAAVNRNNPEVIRLLIRSGADDPTNAEGSPLLAAVAWNKQAAAKELLELGADVNYRETVHGVTPLHCALKKRRDVEFIRLLIEYGARGDIKDGSGRTAAEIMMRRRDKEVRTMATRLSGNA